MGLQFHNYGIIIMILILVFAIIHLGVSIGIIVKNRHYGDIFRPETGLSAFNIVISVLGILVGAFGLICLLAKKQIFGKLMAIVSGVLGIFAFASLITALAINSKNQTDAKNIVDRTQKQYKCCGRTMWLDWAYDDTSPTTVTITEKPTRSVRAAITSLKEDTTDLLDNYPSELLSRIHYIDRREINHLDLSLRPLMLVSRQKRQTISTNSTEYSVSYNDEFLIPRSCCSNLIHNLDGTVQANCTSYDQFYNQGCLKYLIRRSNQQDMGIERVFKLAKEFFCLPLNIKEGYAITKENYGYVQRGQENLDSTNTKLIDEKEAFNIRQSMQPDELPPLFAELENYQLITTFYRNCYDLCMKLLTYLAQCFNIDSDYFTSKHKWELKSGNTLRLLHYPATENQSDECIRAGAHSDYGSLTLLFQHENKSGLQVLDRSTNTWYPVEPYNDMIVVNFGDAFEYWSKGFIKSTVHRVIMPTIDSTKENERFSITFFCHPNDSTLLTPIPSKLILDQKFEKDEHAKHALNHDNEETLTAGQHLAMRLSKTYTY
ncbi:unnamed protein product [Rotaria sordida]|uniref:Fe2OG dioxygenase domain-containing protein n=1 Tax=Rotaria sordida TaxID=392033 RepID=A0A815H6V9_9BILA|nr:unnamed protein product [Rotaria sordida]